MVVIMDGTGDFNNYNIFKNYINECVLLMKPYDNELTIFCIGQDNILDMTEKLYKENINQEHIKNKRIKYYRMTQDQYEKSNKQFYQVYIFLSNTNSDIVFEQKKVDLKNV
jgi:hypothetical protein